MNTEIVNPAVLTEALQFARGRYQRDLLRGRRRWSGADLAGKARQYAGRYADSRANLLARLERAGIPHHIAIGAHNRIQLVLGVW